MGRSLDLLPTDRWPPSGALLDRTGKGQELETRRVTRKANSALTGLEGDVDTTYLKDIETALLRSAAQQAQSNLAAAARTLGIMRPQLVHRLMSRGLKVRNSIGAVATRHVHKLCFGKTNPPLPGESLCGDRSSERCLSGTNEALLLRRSPPGRPKSARPIHPSFASVHRASPR